MLSSYLFRGSVSLLLTFLLVAAPTVNLAGSPASVIAGAVSAHGSNVQVRGVSLASEGTLFFGDSVRVGTASHGNLMISDGNRIELFSDTECVVEKGGQGARVALTSGNLGFHASNKPVPVAFAGYEVLPEAGASGGVMFLTSDYVGIRVMTGNVVVRNLATKKTARISANDVRIVNLKTQDMNVPLAQLASAVPTLPSSAYPLPQRPTGGGLTPAQWGIIIAAIGGGAATGIYFATKCDKDASPSEC